MLARLMLLCCGIAVASCKSSRPAQTGFYCVNIPEGRSAEAGLFIHSVAARLNFSVSDAEFPSAKGPPNRVWEVYGRGVSMFVGTAMKSGNADRYGNRETTFNPYRLEFNVAKTGWWQRIRFEEVVLAATNSAGQLGWSVSKAAVDEACAT